MASITIDAIRANLQTTVDQYFHKLSLITFQELRCSQSIPWASLTDGVASHIYTLIHKIYTNNNRSHIDLALTLTEYILQNDGDRSAYYYPNVPGEQGLNSSFYGSRDALLYLHFMINYRLNRPTALQQHSLLDSFALLPLDSPNEVMFGLAGYLNIALHLYNMTKNIEFQQTSNNIIHVLIERGATKRNSSWTGDSTLNFSHGRAGIFFSLLQSAYILQLDLPSWFFDELEKFYILLQSNPSMGLPMDKPIIMRRSWCQGAGGYAMMWAKAYELTGEKVYSHRAWKTAAFAHTGLNNSHGTNLCCGLGGRAYSLLALDRILPGYGWYERALELTYAAMQRIQSIDQFMTNGLYRGNSGLICLAQDILAPPTSRLGYPLVEVSRKPIET